MNTANRVIRLTDIQELLKKSQADADVERLNVAYVYAAKKHFGQLRQSGEPYLYHPLSVAYILAEMNMDVDSIIAGMLHDTLEDTTATKEELENLFGHDITFLVDGLTKISKIEFKSKEEKQAESFRKMLISMSEDVRVIIIKLADRLHNMRTISYLREDKQKRIAKETLEIYAPLAHRLGIALIKWELEDLCFRTLDFAMYQEIQQKVKLNRQERENYLTKVRDIVADAALKENIKAEVDGRPKHFYSIYNKMQKKNASFEEIYDLLALRVLVGTVSQCYAVLGILHHLFKPVPNRFKDYIAMPKANMYQSLHTTVLGPDGQMVEFQIRTWQMHHVAEEGIAAHWKYKEGKAFNPKTDAQFGWLRQLLENNASTELVETLKEDVLQTQIYVFTPGGDVVELPLGSTPIDFAYSIHSEVGDHCVGAKVSGRIVHLKYRLQNGDKIEVLTAPAQEPRKDWLTFVKTSRAKSRIRAYLRRKETDKAIYSATEALEREFRESGSSLKEFSENHIQLKNVLDKFSVRNLDELLQGIGFGRISARRVAHIVFPDEKEKTDEPPVSKVKRSAAAEPFRIDGVDDMMIKIARCCTPLPGDDVVGYISTGRGIIVHKKDCPNLKDNALSEERLIPVAWADDVTYSAPIRFLASTLSSPGLINSITAVIKDMGLNIIEYSAKAMGGGESEQRFSVELASKEQLDDLVVKLSQVKGIKHIKVL